MPRVLVLLDLVRHPASGRPMRSALSARALELALRLPGAEVLGVHFGEEMPALRDFLGMGLPTIRTVGAEGLAERTEAASALIETNRPDLVIAGGPEDGSGMLPYLLASKLSWPIVSSVVDVRPEDGGWYITRALPRGFRQAAQAYGPVVMCVSESAPAPRLPASGKAARGSILAEEGFPVAANSADAQRAASLRPARRRIRTIDRPEGPSGRSLLDAFMPSAGQGAGQTKLIADLAPDEAADTILHWLAGRGVVEWPPAGKHP